VERDEYLALLADDDVAELRRLGRPRRWKRGTVLSNAGERSDHVVVVQAGRVKVSYFADTGAERILAVCGPGALLGELTILDTQPRLAAVTALETVDGISVPARRFVEFLYTGPGQPFTYCGY